MVEVRVRSGAEGDECVVSGAQAPRGGCLTLESADTSPLEVCSKCGMHEARVHAAPTDRWRRKTREKGGRNWQANTRNRRQVKVAQEKEEKDTHDLLRVHPDLAQLTGKTGLPGGLLKYGNEGGTANERKRRGGRSERDEGTGKSLRATGFGAKLDEKKMSAASPSRAAECCREAVGGRGGEVYTRVRRDGTYRDRAEVPEHPEHPVLSNLNCVPSTHSTRPLSTYDRLRRQCEE
ncbi:hypothetical protein FB451DRAFT_1171148 [Mycena latifolia]|nr:hypothetical protein FB451DRAFT_1171148 [Mycena latifolia]